MRFRVIICTAVLTAAIPVQLYAAGGETSANFTVSQQTMVPGMTLQPGSYSIKVLDHLQDRYIVRIDSASGSEHSTFIGVQDPKLKGSGQKGAVSWGSAPAGTSALRGFTFGSTSPALEFVYPKADAVTLAKLNASKVPAIDPASEGRPAEVSGLSKEDMEIVTLWLLSSSTVGPADAAPSIKAEKMQQQVASNRPPKPVIAKLPHTASALPSMLLGGFAAAAGAGLMMRRRVGATHSS